MSKKELKENFEKLLKGVKKDLLEILVETADELGVEYEITEKGGEPIATPVDEYAAMLKQFGSGTQGVAAEFWVEEAKRRIAKKLKNI